MKFIEDLEDKQEIIENIIEQTSSFDIKNFYTGYYDAALGIITPYQTIYVYVDDHGFAAEEIYDILFEGEFHGAFWQFEFCKKDVVVIQFSKNTETPIWFPNTLNGYQFEEIKRINNQINTLNETLRKESPIKITVNANGLLLNEAISELKNRVDACYNPKRKEKILNEEYKNKL